jgi:hypothetical protein
MSFVSAKSEQAIKQLQVDFKTSTAIDCFPSLSTAACKCAKGESWDTEGGEEFYGEEAEEEEEGGGEENEDEEQEEKKDDHYEMVVYRSYTFSA